ncbi:potassium channel family protein [Sphingomonas sp. LHG3406-1]|uniref:potassium channel family protein n=1 Tax=Sphingomonas sp. LHG3406-1 TaxID=2804617 RepID=UPI002630325B|nr:potassium channel family protein [Sphingomonas sp. LHG3406-1]
MALHKLRSATDTLKEVAAIYLGLLLLAAGAFAVFEQQPFLDSLYWAATTATSVGYGDLSPKTVPGKIVAVSLMHLSLFVIAPLIVVRLIERVTSNQHEFTHEEQERIIAALSRLEERLERLERR